MGFITQVGIVIIILIVIIIIIKTNKALEKIYVEEEDEMVGDDSWDDEIDDIDDMEEVEEVEEIKRVKKNKKVNKAPLRQSQQQTQRKAKERIIDRSPSTMPAKEYSATITIQVLDYRNQPEEEIWVSQYPFTIGRKQDNDLILNDMSVSGYHAMLIQVAGQVFIKDRGSLNQLIIDGMAEEEYCIEEPFVVRLGNVRLKIIPSNTSYKQGYYARSQREDW